MLKIVEYVWILIAVVCLEETIRLFSDDNSKAWAFLGFMALAIIMFFVRRWQRRRYEKRKAENENQQDS